ncbi:MAG: hypothetical protein WB868_15685 [Xanthobacteraceae bacterium]
MELDEDAHHLMMYFKTKALRIGDYAPPADQLAWFDGDVSACEEAQTELQSMGLLELGNPMPAQMSSGVRTAALTREGSRYLQAPAETAK